MDKTLNIGIIGCGSIVQKRHAPEYAANPNCKIIAFSDPIAERVGAMAEEYDCKGYADYKDIINDPKIDAVSVCTANVSHASISIEALNAGKHVLCEKPMATTAAEAAAMLEAAKKADRLLVPAHNQRLFNSNVKAKKILDSGEMGRVITFRAAFKHRGPEAWSADKGKHTWFFKKSATNLGVLGDLGIHKLDLVRWILGERLTEVYAEMVTLDKKYNDGALIELEDNANIMCKTESGIIGTVETSWTNYSSDENYLVLYCEKGRLEVNTTPDKDIFIVMNNGETASYSLGGISTNEKQISSGVIDAFVEAVLNVSASFATAADGYESIATVEACIKSAATGKKEKICY